MKKRKRSVAQRANFRVRNFLDTVEATFVLLDGSKFRVYSSEGGRFLHVTTKGLIRIDPVDPHTILISEL